MSTEHVWEREEKRGESVRNDGESVYRNIVTKKKKKLFMIMEYNKKKKCVVAFCHFLFFLNLLLLSLFIFEDQYFQGGVLFWRTFSMDAVYVFCIVSCLVYSGCSHHSKWVLAKNKKQKKKLSIVPIYLIL